jgi:hypothetical protein
MDIMSEEEIRREAKSLAKVIVLSLKDKKAREGWLESNEAYYPKKDRVVSEALCIVRKALNKKP